MGYLVDKIRRIYEKKIKKMTDSDIRIKRLVENGAKIGTNSKVFTNNIPITRDCPLLNIGNNVTIAGGVSFLLHDNAVIKSETGYTDLIGKINIGDNCFIGYGSIILPGVTLATNIIVAAGSVVTHSFVDSGTIIGGNPAKKIGTVEEYFIKNKDKMLCLSGFTRFDIENLIQQQPEKLVIRSYI